MPTVMSRFKNETQSLWACPPKFIILHVLVFLDGIMECNSWISQALEFPKANDQSAKIFVINKLHNDAPNNGFK